MAAGNETWGNRPVRYRRRRPLPALLLMLVLGITATVVWLKVIKSESDAGRAAHCAPPVRPAAVEAGQAPTTLGQPLAAEALDRTAAAPAAQALVRVVNASPQRGEAATVTEALRQLGFSQVAPAANDPLYPAVTDPALALTCRAQIRFGQQGMPAARTLSLVEPCAELVKDDRQDATVDFAIGMRFDNLQPKPEARRVLERLAEWAAQNPEAQGGLQANASSPPSVDAGLLAAARQVNC